MRTLLWLMYNVLYMCIVTDTGCGCEKVDWWRAELFAAVFFSCCWWHWGTAVWTPWNSGRFFMTCFVLSGTLNVNSVNQSVPLLTSILIFVKLSTGMEMWIKCSVLPRLQKILHSVQFVLLCVSLETIKVLHFFVICIHFFVYCLLIYRLHFCVHVTKYVYSWTKMYGHNIGNTIEENCHLLHNLNALAVISNGTWAEEWLRSTV